MGVRREQQLPVLRPTLERRYGLMAESLLFQTNDPNLLAAADASFGRFPLPTDDRPPLVVALFSEAPRDGDGGRPGTGTGRPPGLRRPLRDHRRSPRGGDRRWRPRRRVGLRQRRDRGGSGRRPLLVHRGDEPVDARPEPRLPGDPRRRRRQERHRRGHRRAGRQWQVDAGDGLRATRVRRLRRGRGLRARAAGLDRAVGACRGRSDSSPTPAT